MSLKGKWVDEKYKGCRYLPKMKTSNISIFSKLKKKLTTRINRRIHLSETFLRQNVLKNADFLMKTFLKHFVGKLILRIFK